MRICMFREAGSSELSLGRVDGDVIVPVERGSAAVSLLKGLISGQDEAAGRFNQAQNGSERISIEDVTFAAPLPNDRLAIICVGKNYHAHAKEFFGSGFDSSGKEEIPSQPVVFSKAGSALIGHRQPINSSLDETQTVDYEGELAVIIGKTAHKVSKAEAMEYVFGYSIMNDVTSRELQKRHNQWLIGKSLDTFGPLGPWIVTRDELHDIEAQRLETKVNGEVRQSAPISDLIFDIPYLIETLSRTMTLRPGDVMATGTPAGVGIGFTPPKYLKPGDIVDVSISGIGTLYNEVR